MLSWMNFLILLLVYLSSLNWTELSSNLLLSRGGRNKTTALENKKKVNVTVALLHRQQLCWWWWDQTCNEASHFNLFVNICSYRLPKGRKSYLLSVNAMALEENLRVGVGKAVVVPQGTGGLQVLCLCCALVISKEPFEGKSESHSDQNALSPNYTNIDCRILWWYLNNCLLCETVACINHQDVPQINIQCLFITVTHQQHWRLGLK